MSGPARFIDPCAWTGLVSTREGGGGQVFAFPAPAAVLGHPKAACARRRHFGRMRRAAGGGLLDSLSAQTGTGQGGGAPFLSLLPIMIYCIMSPQPCAPPQAQRDAPD